MVMNRATHPVDLPDGQYNALQSAYTVTVTLNSGKQVSFKTEVGVRGSNIPIRVSLVNKKAWVTRETPLRCPKGKREYLFNYSLANVRTFLPVFIGACGDNKAEAYCNAVCMLEEANKEWVKTWREQHNEEYVTIYPENYLKN
jgi:hypothetical protein